MVAPLADHWKKNIHGLVPQKLLNLKQDEQDVMDVRDNTFWGQGMGSEKVYI